MENYLGIEEKKLRCIENSKIWVIPILLEPKIQGAKTKQYRQR